MCAKQQKLSNVPQMRRYSPYIARSVSDMTSIRAICGASGALLSLRTARHMRCAGGEEQLRTGAALRSRPGGEEHGVSSGPRQVNGIITSARRSLIDAFSVIPPPAGHRTLCRRVSQRPKMPSGPRPRSIHRWTLLDTRPASHEHRAHASVNVHYGSRSGHFWTLFGHPP